jgi:tRNA dimethylallyltransferase
MTPYARPRALAIMGPTASGKTDLALQLASRFDVEIISVDSAMVYRGMDIGTGKPDRETLQRVPHHLIDILDPIEVYSAGRFVADARRLIFDIAARGRIALLVGGTMLYFRALTRGLAELPTADARVRAMIDAEATQVGWPAMHAQLATIDVTAANRILPNDGQRIQRALEVFRLSGRTLTELHQQTTSAVTDIDLVRFVWSPKERAELYARIEQRFETMIRAGLLEEVAALRARNDLTAELPAVRAVGYRQLWGHFDGQYDLAEAQRLAVVATRHLARRQLIWLRSEPSLPWINCSDENADALVNEKMEHMMTAEAF